MGIASHSDLRSYWRALRRQYAPVPYLSFGIGRVLRFGDKSKSDHDRLRRINELGKSLETMDTSGVVAKGRELRIQIQAEEPPAEALEQSFALIREMSRRVLGLFHYDVQILAGLSMARGAIAEMATGEGKTLVQLLPAYYFGLTGKGVHLATANSYLAERDHAFGAPVLSALGVSSELLPERSCPEKKRAAYLADVTYGTGSEFGFDYLRDQLILLNQPAPVPGEKILNELLGTDQPDLPVVQRKLHAAIIDEADSILIDEAVTPLLISGRGAGENPGLSLYLAARDLASRLNEATDFTADIAKHQILLTEEGVSRIFLELANIEKGLLKRPWRRYVENALRAEYLLKRDHQYVVREDGVLIIDESTGRVKEGSSWRDGLHQAVEAKEEVTVTNESSAQASISRQKFYRLYDHLCGMTGTAMEAAGELWRVYRLPVVEIPRHRPSQHHILPARVFGTDREKLLAVLDEIRAFNKIGRPVLVGARDIETSEILAGMLSDAGIEHELLNANQDEREAEIVARAGQPGAVTVSTAMAGRGTHISLGAGVEEIGGLHVIALEMEESQRIDRQLLGRAGRQGDPGSGQLFLSKEDHLIARAEPELASKIQNRDNSESIARQFRRLQIEAEVRAYQNRIAIMEKDRWNDETKLRVTH